MITFDISLNGKALTRAGVRGFGVLTAMVTSVRLKPARSRGKRIERAVTVEIAGFDSDAKEHVRWLRRRLRVGDRITIGVVKSTSADAPERRDREDPETVARAKRRYFQQLKREYAKERPTRRAAPSR